MVNEVVENPKVLGSKLNGDKKKTTYVLALADRVSVT